MKKTICTILTACLCTCAVFSQQVPDSIRQRFKKDYPSADNVNWRTVNNNYFATYQDTGNRGHTVIYGQDGQRRAQRDQVVSGTYPQGISDYYKTQYPNEKNYQIWLEQDQQGGARHYYSNHNGVDIWFDDTGKYLNGYDPYKNSNSNPPPNNNNMESPVRK